MIGQQYEMHIQCVCGGTLIIVSQPSDEDWVQILGDGDANIFRYEETLSFKHKGNFGEGCLELKKEVLEKLEQEQITRMNGLLGKFISRPSKA
jgi:hypothetical protein